MRLVALRDPDSLSRLFGDVFLSRYGFVFEFSRGRSGTPATVEVSTERVRRLRFTRERSAVR
jgi:hypothetical protein